MIATPYYREVGDEIRTFCAADQVGSPILLKGPTGCGKSRFVEAMAARLRRPLVTVACNDETSAHDLVGRWLVKGGDTVWQDGPVTRAVRTGAVLYLDEVAEAREDVIVVLHPLADHRRQLHVDRLDLTLTAAPGFLLVASFNPGYRRGLRELKPSTRQRFVAIDFDYPGEAVEAEIVAAESGIEPAMARRLVAVAIKIRKLEELGLAETVSTRLLVAAGKLIAAGVPPRRACAAAVAAPLTDDGETARALRDLIDLGI
ncbi:MAG: CbbQ/NirQ/NorQ/GpvN family protein [Deltaproteobacteria bacterium]|nr:CbbQ/NirQ/NorQ/GpvN family protein [Kofleriaceae bacterium]